MSAEKTGRPVDPPPVTGGESLRALIETRFPAFAGRNVREVHRIMDELYDMGARGILVTDIHACRL